MLVDFHMHSIFSDGVETPKDLLQHAIDCNVSMMALTDHDEIDGIQALRAAQKELDPNESIKIVNGCEFSADYKDKSIHILGYCFDENNKDLKNNKKEEDGREDKFEEINDRTNRITALGSAMGAVDLSKTPAKKFRVGAGVGHSANNQAVAIGIGYAPTERLRLNTKISTTTNSTKSNRSNGISIGASYDLDW